MMTHSFTFEVLVKTKAIRVPPLKTILMRAGIEDESLTEHYLSASVFALHLNSDTRSDQSN
jgi:hypothetical protein